MWSETAHDKDAPDKVETSASQWVSSLVLWWSVSSPLLQGVELVVWRVGLEVEFSAVQNGYRTIWILPSSLPGNWMAKTEQAGVKYQYTFRFGEIRIVTSRSPFWVGKQLDQESFSNWLSLKIRKLESGFFPLATIPPDSRNWKVTVSPIFFASPNWELFLHSFFSYLPFLPWKMSPSNK